MELDQKVIEKFLKYVDMRGDDECWPWTAKINNVGRGVFTFDKKRKGRKRQVTTYCAHHVSYHFFIGGNEDIRYLDHSCENLWCCNPKHIIPRTLENRLLDNVEYSDGDDPCWLWTGYIADNGYGTIHYQGESDLVHRVSYEFFNGDIPENMYVRHTCHERNCICPEHLVLGTHKDNMKDMTEANRQAKGEDINNSKLTKEDVLEIKKLISDGKHYQYEIAEMFDVKRSTITDINRGKTWSWLKG